MKNRFNSHRNHKRGFFHSSKDKKDIVRAIRANQIVNSTQHFIKQITIGQTFGT